MAEATVVLPGYLQKFCDIANEKRMAKRTAAHGSVVITSDAKLLERARSYMAKMPPAISGQGGHDQTLCVARVLVHDFALPEADAWTLLNEYNAVCQPPWSEKELRHKLDEAMKLSRAGQCDTALAGLRDAGHDAKAGEHGVNLDAIIIAAKATVGKAGIKNEPKPQETRDSGAPTSSSPPPSKVRLTRADQIEMRPPHWLLRGMLERDTFALIFGDPGCGKSFLAIDWACRIATGTPWRGHPVKGGPVVYIAGEGQQGFGRRIRAWSKHHGVGLAGVPLYLAPAVAIPEPADLVSLITAIDTGISAIGKPVMIVLDTLARCFGGGDENSTQDMSKFVTACDAIRQRYACTILIVHHTGHGDKSRARGAIALKAALDAEYRLANENGMLLTVTKMKDAETPLPLGLRLIAVELPGLRDDYDNPVTSAAVEVIDADVGAIMAQAKAAMRPRGKWQEIGLNVARHLTGHSKDGKVTIDAWRDACAAAGMARQNQHRIMQSLADRGEIVLNNELLSLPAP
jgi:hypothetical protein